MGRNSEASDESETIPYSVLVHAYNQASDPPTCGGGGRNNVEWEEVPYLVPGTCTCRPLDRSRCIFQQKNEEH